MFEKHRAPRREPPAGLADPDFAGEDLRLAYERGRRDERAARKRHPVLMSLTVAAALVGGVVIALAAREGSFADGGARFDKGVSVAAAKAGPVMRDAARNLRKPDTAG